MRCALIGDPVVVVAGREFADEQRAGGRRAAGGKVVGELEEPLDQAHPGADRVDGAGLRVGLVERVAFAADDEVPEREAAAARDEVAATAELAGDDGVAMDAARDHPVERDVAAGLVQPVPRDQDRAAVRESLGLEQLHRRDHRGDRALHVRGAAAVDRVALPTRLALGRGDGVHVAVPLDRRAGAPPGIRAMTLGEPSNSSSRTTSSTPASRRDCRRQLGHRPLGARRRPQLDHPHRQLGDRLGVEGPRRARAAGRSSRSSGGLARRRPRGRGRAWGAVRASGLIRLRGRSPRM